MEHFTPFTSLLGGVLIGLASSMMLYFHGRIAGISGIFGGVLRPLQGDIIWRLMFIIGLFAGGVLLALVAPTMVAMPTDRSLAAIAVGGLLVGYGTRLGSGCTSGHGICGLTRGSTRSLVAVCAFMGAGMVTATTISWFTRLS